MKTLNLEVGVTSKVRLTIVVVEPVHLWRLIADGHSSGAFFKLVGDWIFTGHVTDTTTRVMGSDQSLADTA